MEKYMNEPVNYSFTDDDIIKEYKCYKDIKKVSTVFLIDSKEVRRVLKSKGVI